MGYWLGESGRTNQRRHTMLSQRQRQQTCSVMLAILTANRMLAGFCHPDVVCFPFLLTSLLDHGGAP